MAKLKSKERKEVSDSFVSVVEKVLYSSFVAMSHERLDNSVCLEGKTILNTEGDEFVEKKHSIHDAVLKPSDMVGGTYKSIGFINGELSHHVTWRPSMKEISTAYRQCKLFANRVEAESCPLDELVFCHIVCFNSNDEMTYNVRSACGWSERKKKIVALGDLDARMVKGIDGKATATGFVMKNQKSIQADIIMSIYGPTWWQLKVSASNSPRIIFHSTPRSVLALLCNRDLENGKTRRDALLHWVGSHKKRASGNEADAVLEIKEYLRGKTEAVFGDLKIEIIENTISADEQIENIQFAV